MESNPNSPRDITPGQPGRGAPLRPQPMMDDFGPRRPATSGMPTARPGQPQTRANPITQPTPTSVPIRPQTPAPSSARPAPLMSDFGGAPTRTHAQPSPQPRQAAMPAPPQPEEVPEKEPKQRNTTGHAGLVGLVIFVVLTTALLSPLIPGKIMDLPGNSTSSSSGDQSLACAYDLKNTSSTTTYGTKLGSPLIYKYATTTTLKGTCNGKSQTAIGGRTAQFSPLAVLVDTTLALVVAFIVAAVWRKIFGTKV